MANVFLALHVCNSDISARSQDLIGKASIANEIGTSAHFHSV